ncbi:hypothetical protein [Micromonospora craterilacus]|uniref:hypothetical protein n=1 Tax=Micromonospora craterilacus TaxID=1655439 RepID=UPI0018F51960|nr:hypothetical protein [Micromonospora craterilacus]
MQRLRDPYTGCAGDGVDSHHHLVRAEDSQPVAPIGCADHRGRVCAATAGELHDDPAHSTGRPGDQHPPPGHRTGRPQRPQRGEPDRRQRCDGGGVHAGGSGAPASTSKAARVAQAPLPRAPNRGPAPVRATLAPGGSAQVRAGVRNLAARGGAVELG